MTKSRDDTRTFSISELAREFDVTTRSIRFYEDQGLLNPTRGDHNIGSFSISEAGLWHDFADDTSGDLVDLLVAIRQLMTPPEPKKRPIGFITHD